MKQSEIISEYEYVSENSSDFQDEFGFEMGDTPLLKKITS